MNFIKTKSFELAVYKKGNEDSEKLALLLPGKLDTKDYSHMKSHVDFLEKKGFLAVSFDPPGTWESKGENKDYCITNYLKAINEIIEYFGNKKTILIGHSRGGSLAILAGTTNSNVIAFAAIMSPMNFQVRPREIKKFVNGVAVSTRDNPKGEDVIFRIPESFVEDSRQYDFSEDLKNCVKPKLFVAGTQDDLLPVEGIKEVYDYSPEPKYFEIIDYGHDYRKSPKMIEKVERILEEFLEKIEIN
ncbi:MAG: alpha/beta fold hydrolase [Candidatus Diapherotrites archaeon]|jgi:pimeloyl-ACP methyl ester carboxylesterase|nr:alpha/beta fold hydrolase [Candidatus Diapherotrites archaeon]